MEMQQISSAPSDRYLKINFSPNFPLHNREFGTLQSLDIYLYPGTFRVENLRIQWGLWSVNRVSDYQLLFRSLKKKEIRARARFLSHSFSFFIILVIIVCRHSSVTRPSLVRRLSVAHPSLVRHLSVT